MDIINPVTNALLISGPSKFADNQRTPAYDVNEPMLFNMRIFNQFFQLCLGFQLDYPCISYNGSKLSKAWLIYHSD
jgi:hypothetical protein